MRRKEDGHHTSTFLHSWIWRCASTKRHLGYKCTFLKLNLEILIQVTNAPVVTMNWPLLLPLTRFEYKSLYHCDNRLSTDLTQAARYKEHCTANRKLQFFKIALSSGASRHSFSYPSTANRTLFHNISVSFSKKRQCRVEAMQVVFGVSFFL